MLPEPFRFIRQESCTHLTTGGISAASGVWGVCSESNALVGTVTKPRERFLEESLKMRRHSLLAKTAGWGGLWH